MQITFIKHILQNYYKNVFLDFNFNCHGNKKLNQNSGSNKLYFFYATISKPYLQASKKRLKLFKYIKNKIFPSGISFLTRTAFHKGERN